MPSKRRKGIGKQTQQPDQPPPAPITTVTTTVAVPPAPVRPETSMGNGISRQVVRRVVVESEEDSYEEADEKDESGGVPVDITKVTNTVPAHTPSMQSHLYIKPPAGPLSARGRGVMSGIKVEQKDGGWADLVRINPQVASLLAIGYHDMMAAILRDNADVVYNDITALLNDLIFGMHLLPITSQSSSVKNFYFPNPSHAMKSNDNYSSKYRSASAVKANIARYYFQAQAIYPGIKTTSVIFAIKGYLDLTQPTARRMNNNASKVPRTPGLDYVYVGFDNEAWGNLMQVVKTGAAMRDVTTDAKQYPGDSTWYSYMNPQSSDGHPKPIVCTVPQLDGAMVQHTAAEIIKRGSVGVVSAILFVTGGLTVSIPGGNQYTPSLRHTYTGALKLKLHSAVILNKAPSNIKGYARRNGASTAAGLTGNLSIINKANFDALRK